MKKNFIADVGDAARPERFLPLKIKPLMPGFGAMVGGVDLARELSRETQAILREAWLQFGVIFLRGQERLSPERHWELAAIFGTPDAGSHMVEKGAGVDLLITDAGKPPVANTWHSDNTNLEHPSLGTFIQIQDCPPVGGNTMWASAQRAYEFLSPNMKACLEGLTAVHYWNTRGYREQTHLAARLDAEFLDRVRDYPPVEHPVVLTHPMTGRKSIYVNETYTKFIKGLHVYESRCLMDFLASWIRMPEFCLTHHWQENDIAVWDNFAMQHYALADYSAFRVNQRVTFTVEGQAPRAVATPASAMMA